MVNNYPTIYVGLVVYRESYSTAYGYISPLERAKVSVILFRYILKICRKISINRIATLFTIYKI